MSEQQAELSVYQDVDSFELAQRSAKLLSSSNMVPTQFQGNIPNCVLALNLSFRLKADVFAVMQGLDIIHGKPAWRATYLISMVNTSGRFSPLRFRMEGEGMERSCVAYAKSLEDDEIVEGPAVTMKMAEQEGWLNRSGSKWKTMPDLMLSYRAGAFFSRLYAPDLTLGIRTVEEEIDVRDITPVNLSSDRALEDALSGAAPAEVVVDHRETEATVRAYDESGTEVLAYEQQPPEDPEIPGDMREEPEGDEIPMNLPVEPPPPQPQSRAEVHALIRKEMQRADIKDQELDMCLSDHIGLMKEGGDWTRLHDKNLKKVLNLMPAIITHIHDQGGNQS